MAMDMLGQLYWDPRKSYDIETQLNMAYTVAFLLAQAPAYFLVTRLSLQRVMPQLVLIKGWFIVPPAPGNQCMLLICIEPQ